MIDQDYIEEEVEVSTSLVPYGSRDITFIDQYNGSHDDLMHALEMRSSYVDARTETIDEYVNKTIKVRGFWLLDVPAGVTAQGEVYNDFTSLLLKIDDPDKKSGHVVIKFHGKQALRDAETIWLKYFGLGDSKTPIKMEVTLSGKRTCLRIVK